MKITGKKWLFYSLIVLNYGLFIAIAYLWPQGMFAGLLTLVVWFLRQFATQFKRTDD